MSFKIFTYNDPFRLNQTSFWESIKKAPHLCSSQVMVNGFRDLFEGAFESLLCPIDNVLKNVYGGWFNNIEKRIAQYIAITSQLEWWQKRENGNRSELYAALRHNQNSLLEALRLFVELGIDVNSLHKSQANLEQKVFIALMKEISNQSSPMYEPFTFKDTFSLSDLCESFKTTISKEIEREQTEADSTSPTGERRQIRIAKLKQLGDIFSKDNLRQVVIHGIHQFTPLQLRFIMLMDALGIEVVFLYNYQSEYREIYSTWEQLYQLFGVEINADTNLGEYRSRPDSRSQELAKAVGQLVETATTHGAQDRLRWYQAGQRVQMVSFDNITEYAGFVSRYFDKAQKINDKQPIYAMTEQVYSAGREIHDLLRIYYPEQSGDRHFLSYPIGQFFAGLYRIWDTSLGQIKIDWPSIKECFTAGILQVASPDRLNSIVEMTNIFFSDIKDYDDFIIRIQDYKMQYLRVQEMQNELGQQLRRIVFYRPHMVNFEDIEILEAAFSELNSVAVQLFKQGSDGVLSFGEHFKRLELFIRSQMLDFAEAEEKQLVEGLLERFTQVSLNTTLSGTMNDLKNGLHYYLKQKELERPDWIVRNFAQIEGDILLSRGQHDRAIREGSEEPVYHFACLSDRMMNQTVDSILPWPLSDYFIRKAFSPVALIFQVYYTALSDYAKFLRYALFYGLYYNQCKVRLSYVVHVEDKEEQPYFPLRMLGIIAKRDTDEDSSYLTSSFPIPERTYSRYVVDRNERIDFFLCPYKYYLDMVCRGGIVIDNAFIMQRYYSNMLVHAVWKAMENKPRMQNSAERVRSILKSTQDTYRSFLPFWRDANDLFDMLKVAENYIEHDLWEQGRFKRYDGTHMTMRFLFWKATFTAEESVNHPYLAFEAKKRNRNGAKEYPLHAIRPNVEQPLLYAMQDYMGLSENNHAIAGDWCGNCSHQKLCMKPYEVELNVPSMEEE